MESVHSHDKLRITGEEDKKINDFCFQAKSTLIGLRPWKNRIKTLHTICIISASSPDWAVYCQVAWLWWRGSGDYLAQLRRPPPAAPDPCPDHPHTSSEIFAKNPENSQNRNSKVIDDLTGYHDEADGIIYHLYRRCYVMQNSNLRKTSWLLNS